MPWWQPGESFHNALVYSENFGCYTSPLCSKCKMSPYNKIIFLPESIRGFGFLGRVYKAVFPTTVFICREVTSSDQALLNSLTTLIVDHFAPRSRVDASFQASWAFIATWFQVPGDQLRHIIVCFFIIYTRCHINLCKIKYWLSN